MSQEIGIDLLVPHPQNCNYMDDGKLQKLELDVALRPGTD